MAIGKQVYAKQVSGCIAEINIALAAAGLQGVPNLRDILAALETAGADPQAVWDAFGPYVFEIVRAATEGLSAQSAALATVAIDAAVRDLAGYRIA